MAFTEGEITEHMKEIEDRCWSRRRPPLHLRDRVREGQRIEGQSVELFFVRPVFERPGLFTEESIAKVQHVRSQSVWRLFWKRADGKWHAYPPCREVKSLADALRLINEDAHHCLFG